MTVGMINFVVLVLLGYALLAPRRVAAAPGEAEPRPDQGPPRRRVRAGRLMTRGRMAGRTALITGSTGIAEASAELFAAEGARVFVVSRTEGHCRELVDGLTAGGAEAAWFAADLEDEAAADAAVAAAVERFGRLDALFNVAGGSGRRFGDGPVHEMTMDGWERTMSLNARTHITMSRAVLRRMLEQPPDADGARGAILNMTSVLASSPAPDLFPTHAYAASKGAIATLTRSMAAYYVRHGIRVNAVAPSLTTSRMSARAAADAATQEFAARRQPLSGWLPAGRGRGRRGPVPALARRAGRSPARCCSSMAAGPSPATDRGATPMTFVRTVLGDIDPAELGVTYAHEHLVIGPSHTVDLNPDFLLVDVDKAVAELAPVAGAGPALGHRRDAHRRGPGRAAAGRGEPPEWRARGRADRAASRPALSTAALERDGDHRGAGGPVRRGHHGRHRCPRPQRSRHPSDGPPRGGHQDRAAATAGRRSGTHGCSRRRPSPTFERGVRSSPTARTARAPWSRCRCSCRFGVLPPHIVLSHVDKVTDRGYQREIIASGAFAEYDQSFRWKDARNGTLDALRWAVEDGTIDRVAAGDGRGSPGLLDELRWLAGHVLAPGFVLVARCTSVGWATSSCISCSSRDQRAPTRSGQPPRPPEPPAGRHGGVDRPDAGHPGPCPDGHDGQRRGDIGAPDAAGHIPTGGQRCREHACEGVARAGRVDGRDRPARDPQHLAPRAPAGHRRPRASRPPRCRSGRTAGAPPSSCRRRRSGWLPPPRWESGSGHTRRGDRRGRWRVRG